MASKLLNVFNKIEQGRQEQLQTARALGYQLSDNASFAELAACFGDAPASLEDTLPYNTGDWTWPEEWPDLKGILAAAQPYQGWIAGAIVMFDAVKMGSSITLPFYGSSGTTSLYVAPGAKYYKLSDGYSNTATSSTSYTHTWDTTKDIVVTEGKYPGTYRWALLYYDPNATDRNKQEYTLSGWPCVAIIVGNLQGGNAASKNMAYLDTCNTSTSYTTTAGKDILRETLIDFEVLDSFTGEYSGTTSGYKFCFYMKNLENLDLGPITKIRVSNNQSTGYAWFQGLPKLRKLDYHNVAHFQVSSSQQGDVTLMLTDCFRLNTIITNSYTIGINGSLAYNVKTIICNTPDLEYLTTVNTGNLNRAITSNVPLKLNSLNGAYNYMPNQNYYTVLDLDFVMGSSIVHSFLDASAFTMSTSNNFSIYKSFTPPVTDHPDSYHLSFNQSRYLHTVIFPENVTYRCDFRLMPISTASILDLFNKLHTITETETVYYPEIRLTNAQAAHLTAEQIAIATNKGWDVIITDLTN